MSIGKQARGNLLLATAALIWGLAFVAQSVGMEYIGPFTFNAIRMIMGGLVLIPCIFLLQRWDNHKTAVRAESAIDKRQRQITLLRAGVSCGLILCIATSLQQIGIVYTTAGKAGFITALYIILVPILSIFLRRRITWVIWVSVLIAIAGLYLLCINETLSISWGDLLVLISALFFAIHILVVDHFASKVEGVKMSCIQFFIAGIICLLLMFLLERPDIHAILDCWLPLLYVGILSTAVAYTMQILGQRDTHPVIASLIMSAESVFAVVFGWLLLNEMLTLPELLGCLLMLTAMILAQLFGQVTETPRMIGQS